ncbi:MAG: glycosyltransferase family 4 protein [Deltaproteobacteria bacterium]|nr:glycosyltransferase family 4 protein [Deltaproteobacteria bacterium]
MKILVISQMFPCKRHPTSAIFFANLMKELAPKIDELIIVTPRVYIPKFLIKFNKRWRKWYLDPVSSKENGMEILRPYSLFLRGVKFGGINGILIQYSLSRFLKNLVKTRKIELILGYNMIPEGIAAVRLAKMLKLPSGFWAIGSDVNDFANYNRINHYLSKKCIEGCDIVFAESEDLAVKVRSFSQKSVPVKTFYKGIDVSNFQNMPPRNALVNKLQLDPGKKYILFAGRVIYDKGIYELAQAFSRIAKRYQSLDLIIIGEEIEKEKLKAKLENYGIMNRVIFKGTVQFKDVASYMRISDLLVLPSWAEGLPNVVMEAMATGLPVVATNVGGIPEVLENEVTGLSVPAKNDEKLAEALIRMIEDADLRAKCVSNAKKIICEKFDVKKNTFTLYAILQEMKNSYSKTY